MFVSDPCNSNFFALARNCRRRKGFFSICVSKKVICAGKKSADAKWLFSIFASEMVDNVGKMVISLGKIFTLYLSIFFSRRASFSSK